MSISMLDFIMLNANETILTKSRFRQIRNHGTPEELEQALEQMEAAGGYENLPD